MEIFALFIHHTATLKPPKSCFSQHKSRMFCARQPPNTSLTQESRRVKLWSARQHLRFLMVMNARRSDRRHLFSNPILKGVFLFVGRSYEGTANFTKSSDDFDMLCVGGKRMNKFSEDKAGEKKRRKKNILERNFLPSFPHCELFFLLHIEFIFTFLSPLFSFFSSFSSMRRKNFFSALEKFSFFALGGKFSAFCTWHCVNARLT